jgi:hypothetical protein
MVLLLFVCCGKDEIQPMEVQMSSTHTVLAEIDSLMWQRPDSALMCLLPYFDTACRDSVHTVSTANDWHYANLLLAELLYKNDNPQLNRTDLLQAVDYYDSLCCCRDAARNVSTDPTLIFLDARAHYINGVGYYEHDSVVEACQEYLKALEVMEVRFEEKEQTGKEALFTAFIYTRLTDLYSDLYLHEQAIFFARLSLPIYLKQENASWYPARMLTEIGSHYEVLEEFDSAYYYYAQGKNLISDTNDLIYRDINTHLSSISYKTGDAPLIPLNRLHTLLIQARSEQEYASRCLTIGEIYYCENQLDSAWHYLGLSFIKAQSVGAKKQSAEWLAEIAQRQGRNAETYEFASFLIPFANLEENLSGTKAKLVALYDTYRKAKLELQRQERAKKEWTLVLLIVAGMSVVILTLCFLFYWKKQSHQKLEAQLEAERHTHKVQQAALSGRLRQSNAALKAKDEMAPTITTMSSVHKSITAQYYVEEPICQQIIAVCNDDTKPIKSNVPVSIYADIALDDTQKAQLKDAAMRHYGPFFEKLKRQYPSLKEKDLYYCYLCLLGLDNTQIAALLQKTISTIWDRERRLKNVFCSEDKVSVFLNKYMLDNQDIV